MQLSVSVAATSASEAANKGALEQRSQAVQAFFQERLGLTPADNTGAYLSYHIPASQASSLPEFLQELEAAGSQLGVSDVNIGLTSLEEVGCKSRLHAYDHTAYAGDIAGQSFWSCMRCTLWFASQLQACDRTAYAAESHGQPFTSCI